MKDKILESLFLDDGLWTEVIGRGVDKGIPKEVLRYFQEPRCRAELCGKIASGEYRISAPRTGYKKKDDGGERVFLVNSPMDRVFLAAVNKWLMRNMSGAMHPSCTSYREGIGIGATVRRLSREIVRLSLESHDGVVGRKFDIHHYFDSVAKPDISKAFDAVERRWGHSSVMDVLREYYSSDLYYDSRKSIFVEKPMGIKQGCAVSAYLANVLLYPLDSEISKTEGCYIRYSDDIIYVGKHYGQVTSAICASLEKMGLSLNAAKTEDVRSDRFIRFLGFDIRGGEITLSRKWVKEFQKNVDCRTILDRSLIDSVRKIRKEGGPGMEEKLERRLTTAAESLVRFLYHGNGRHSWAELVLPVINVSDDISEMDRYCLDALRAVYTGKTSIGSLGKSAAGGIQRGTGRNVAANRKATEHLSAKGRPQGWLSGYITIETMRRTVSNRMLFRALTQDILDSSPHPVYGGHDPNTAAVEELERRYEAFLCSRPDGARSGRFYARTLEMMTVEDLLGGEDRRKALEALEEWLGNGIGTDGLFPDGKSWYWQSSVFPELVLLREWFR